MRRRLRHCPALAGFAALTIVWLWPVLRNPGDVIPGAGAGDNLTFVWNTWSMHHSLATGQSPLRTSMLFAPWGTSLALNTHVALPALAGAALLPFLDGSVITATNLIVVLNLFLNFVAAYALAFRITQRIPAACVAAFVFGCSPYIGAHLQGHFNLVAGWVLPLAILATLRLLERGTNARAAFVALTSGTLVYVDYYYTVYAVLVIALLVGVRALELRRTTVTRRPWQRRALLVIGALVAIDVAVIAIIAGTGGTTLRAGALRISMQGIDNPIAAAGVLLMAAAAVLIAPALRLRLARDTLRSDLRRLTVPLAIAGLLSAPILISIVMLWLNGDYTGQHYFWRSAPRGIDLATMVLGNPSGAVTGPLTQAAYSALRIDGVEQCAWLGPAVLALCAIAATNRDRRDRTRPWLVIGGCFAVWALGPYLVAAGTSVWVLLPATVIRFIPFVANARIPSRAIVVVFLSAALLAAIGWQILLDRDRRALAGALLLLLVVDYLPARPPLFGVDRPALYEVVRTLPEPGIICELPLGLRDGFGGTGRLDERVLGYQTRHARPMTGGFVARLSPRLRAAYAGDAILGPLLRVSGGAPMTAEPALDRHTAGSLLMAHGIRHVVLNRATAPADLIAYVHATLPLRTVATDAERTLYAIDMAAAAAPRR